MYLRLVAVMSEYIQQVDKRSLLRRHKTEIWKATSQIQLPDKVQRNMSKKEKKSDAGPSAWKGHERKRIIWSVWSIEMIDRIIW